MTRKLLIVIDQDRLTNAAVSAALSRRCYAVASAHNVREAMGIVARCRPQAVVLDIDLGELSGLALIPLLRVANPDCRILVVSSCTGGNGAIEARALGAHHVLDKPADIDAVTRALECGDAAGREVDAGIHVDDDAPRAAGGFAPGRRVVDVDTRSRGQIGYLQAH